MTRERAKELLPAIKHWANGGELWWYNHNLKQWRRYVGCDIDFNDLEYNEAIIEDKFFEARKAYALGKPVEFKDSNNVWTRCAAKPFWNDNISYRPAKLKWYEDPCNRGKVIMVRDYNSEEWNTALFKEYNRDSKSPFIDLSDCVWKQARLLTEEDLAKEIK